MITTILSGLALLVVIADLILTVREKKRGEERNAAFEAWKDSARDTILHYIDSEIECITNKHDVFAEKAETAMKELRGRVVKLDDDFTGYVSREQEGKEAFEEKISAIQKRLHDLEHGIVPDYAEALAAKNSVDEFNKGLSAIMGFDPIVAYRKQAEKEKYGGEVE